MVSLRGIDERIQTCIQYLESCSAEHPPNREIVNEIQNIINTLPNLHVGEMGRGDGLVGRDSGSDDDEDERHVYGMGVRSGVTCSCCSCPR